MIHESTASRAASMTGRLNFLNTGATGNAAVRVYEAPRPATSADTPTSTMLVSIPLDDPAGAVVGATLELAQLDPGLILNTGIAAWVRVVNKNGDTAFDMDAGATGSEAECILSQTTLYAGGQVSILSAVLG